ILYPQWARQRRRAASPDVLTYHNDNAKTGQQLHEEILTPANVTAAKFGKLWVLNVDGKVDAHGERAINFCRIEKRDASVHGGTQKRNHFLTISRRAVIALAHSHAAESNG